MSFQRPDGRRTCEKRDEFISGLRNANVKNSLIENGAVNDVSFQEAYDIAKSAYNESAGVIPSIAINYSSVNSGSIPSASVIPSTSINLLSCY